MLLAGIDEVGRGAWAGPLVVAGVVLDDEKLDFKLRDSKFYTHSQRCSLVAQLQDVIEDVHIEIALPEYIDYWGLGRSIRQAFIDTYLALSPTCKTIVDGNVNYLSSVDYNTQALVRADDQIAAVSAASIIAKVFRDKYMHDVAEHFPVYGFESHVGYGTSQHKQMLREYGICSQHRMSFKPVAMFA